MNVSFKVENGTKNGYFMPSQSGAFGRDVSEVVKRHLHNSGGGISFSGQLVRACHLKCW